VIYTLACTCHEEGDRYVGQTTQTVASRLARHRAAALRFQREGKRLSRTQNWILKHGPENIVAATIDNCADQETLDRAERFWIATLPNLTNHLAGGRDRVAPAGTLTERQVQEVRLLAQHFVPFALIADQYGITVDSVGNIHRRKTWKHLPEPKPFDPKAWMDHILEGATPVR
jgi:hypothetical protein